MMAYLLGPDAM